MYERGYLLGKLIKIAEGEIGVKEEGGNNKGPRIVEYQKATWIDPGPWPWCAAFCCWILREWLKDEEVLEAIGKSKDEAEKWRCKYPSAFGWEEWAKKNNLSVLPESELAKAGDFMVFDMSHIAIVTEDQKGFETGLDMVHTIEGNTGTKGGRDSESGDGVWRKLRHYTMTRSYVRIIP